MKRNDTTPAFEATLCYPADAAVDLSTATSVRFLMATATAGARELKVDGLATVVQTGAGVDAVNKGLVRYGWVVGDTDTAGGYDIEFEVTWSDGTKQTFPDDGYFRFSIAPDLG